MKSMRKLLLSLGLLILTSQNSLLSLDLELRFKALQDFIPSIIGAEHKACIQAGINKINTLEADLKFLESLPTSISEKEYLNYLKHGASVVGLLPWFVYICRKLYKMQEAKLKIPEKQCSDPKPSKNQDKGSKAKKTDDHNVSELPQSKIQIIKNFLDNDAFAILFSICVSSICFKIRNKFSQSYICYNNERNSISKTQHDILTVKSMIKGFQSILDKILKAYGERSEKISRLTLHQRIFMDELDLITRDINYQVTDYSFLSTQYDNFKKQLFLRLKR